MIDVLKNFCFICTEKIKCHSILTHDDAVLYFWLLFFAIFVGNFLWCSEPEGKVNLKNAVTSAFTAATIATSALAPLDVQAVDMMSSPSFGGSSTLISEKVIREGIYGTYEADLTQTYDKAESTFKGAKETKSKKGMSSYRDNHNALDKWKCTYWSPFWSKTKFIVTIGLYSFSFCFNHFCMCFVFNEIKENTPHFYQSLLLDLSLFLWLSTFGMSKKMIHLIDFSLPRLNQNLNHQKRKDGFKYIMLIVGLILCRVYSNIPIMDGINTFLNLHTPNKKIANS